MPFKDAEARKQAARESMERKRKGLTSGVNKEEGLTTVNVNPEYTPKQNRDMISDPPHPGWTTDGYMIPNVKPDPDLLKKFQEKYRGCRLIKPGQATGFSDIIEALSDVKTRAKLRAVCQSLGNKGLLSEVRYGLTGPTMDVVAEYLTALK